LIDQPGTEEVASLPYTPPRHALTSACAQYLILLRLFLAEYRSLWFFYVFFGFVWPVGFIFFLKMTEGTISPAQAIFILGGNMATAIAFGPLFLLINKIGQGRERHEFEYWATLPLPKLAFVLAAISVAVLLSLPGLIGAYIIGMLMLGLSFSGNIVLLALIPVGALPLAGLGAMLGSYAPDGQTAGVIGNIMTIVIGFLSPMFLTLVQLPPPLRIIALFIPTTYVADLFRSALGGHAQIPVFVDVLVIVVCSVSFLLLVHRKMDWRIGS
jgi:ABC-2 type transport system permease protein